MTTYYVSGKMRGISQYNFPMFDSLSDDLRSKGDKAINPADHDRDVDPLCESRPDFATGDPALVTDEQMHFHKLIGWDLQQISSHECDAIVMLPGWEASEGARHERYVAEACGKQVWLAHFAGTSGSYHDPVRNPAGKDTLEYHGWYMTLDNDQRRLAGASYGPAAMDPCDRWDEHLPRGSVYPSMVAYDAADLSTLRNPAWPTSEVVEYGQGITGIETLRMQPNMSPPIGHFQTKDSGKRIGFDSGMVRDTDEGKPRYDLIPVLPHKRLAELYARGAVKYGDRNWQNANSQEELARFKASAERHFMQWKAGDTDEDHAIAVVWNIYAAIWLADKLEV